MQNKFIIYSYLSLLYRKFANLNFFLSFLLQYNSLYKLRLFTILNIMHYIDFTVYFSKKISEQNLQKKKRKNRKRKNRKLVYKLTRGFFYKRRKIMRSFNIILRLKRKNLFITAIHTKTGDVIFKRNLGTCGFKKKVKFTGFALEKTTFFFATKITMLLLKYFKPKLIKPLWALISKLRRHHNRHLEHYMLVNSVSQQDGTTFLSPQPKMSVLEKRLWRANTRSAVLYENQLQGAHKLSLKALKARAACVSTKRFRFLLQTYHAFDNDRNSHFKKRIKKLNKCVTLVIKNNIKYWPFRYIMRGFYPMKKQKRFFKINKIKVRVPVSHSLGFRLKKKRRV